MKRVLSSQDEMKAFADRMYDCCENDRESGTMANLAYRIAKHRNMRLSVTTDPSESSEVILVIQLIDFIVQRFNGSNWMMPAVVLLRNTGAFGSLNASYLRRVMREVGDALDSTEAQEYLESELDLSWCEGCEQWEYSDEMQSTYEDATRCRSCIGNSYTWSDYYDSFIFYENSVQAIDENGRHVTISRHDDDFEYDDDDDTYYHINYNHSARVLGDYHASKRNQKLIRDDWSTTKHRWLGVELEVEMRDNYADRAEKAKQLNDLINNGEVGRRVFFERDGSLTNGIEIITQPMSLPMHHDLWQWLNNRSAITGLRSHNTTTCGLHVHVNRDALSQIQIARIVTFINDPNNEDLIRAIARRYAEGYCRIKEKKLDNAHHSTDRYEAVNITGSNTIEFRIFKGSMKYESVVAAIEFANAMVDFSSKFVKAEELSTTNFLQFIHNDAFKETNYLRPYINNRLELA